MFCFVSIVLTELGFTKSWSSGHHNERQFFVLFQLFWLSWDSPNSGLEVIILIGSCFVSIVLTELGFAKFWSIGHHNDRQLFCFVSMFLTELGLTKFWSWLELETHHLEKVRKRECKIDCQIRKYG